MLHREGTSQPVAAVSRQSINQKLLIPSYSSQWVVATLNHAMGGGLFTTHSSVMWGAVG